MKEAALLLLSYGGNEQIEFDLICREAGALMFFVSRFQDFRFHGEAL